MECSVFRRCSHSTLKDEKEPRCRRSIHLPWPAWPPPCDLSGSSQTSHTFMLLQRHWPPAFPSVCLACSCFRGFVLIVLLRGPCCPQMPGELIPSLHLCLRTDNTFRETQPIQNGHSVSHPILFFCIALTTT